MKPSLLLQVSLLMGLSLCFTNQVHSQCPSADIFLNSMDELNQFASDYPNCTRLDHSIQITGEDIWTLIPIAGLDSIMGDMVFTAIGLVNNFSGLTELQYVAGDLRIQNNPFLSNLSGLQGLTEVEGECIIQNNPSQVSLNGLTSLQRTGGLKLLDLPSLAQLNALAQLDSIYGDLELHDAPSLVNITGLSGLLSLGGHLSIKQCGIEDLLPFSGLSHIGSYLELNENPMLASIDLTSLVTIAGDLRIKNLDQLADLNGLEALDLVQGDLQLIANAALVDILSLDQSISYTDSVIITDSPMLELCDVHSICDHLEGSSAALFSGNGINCGSTSVVQAACISTGGIEEVKNRFQVFPNPFTSQFHIQSDVRIDHWELKDLTGRKVYSASGNGNSVPDLSHIPAGTYVFSIHPKEGTYSQLLVKE